MNKDLFRLISSNVLFSVSAAVAVTMPSTTNAGTRRLPQYRFPELIHVLLLRVLYYDDDGDDDDYYYCDCFWLGLVGLTLRRFQIVFEGCWAQRA